MAQAENCLAFSEKPENDEAGPAAGFKLLFTPDDFYRVRRL
jgi:hypothetical protein